MAGITAILIETFSPAERNWDLNIKINTSLHYRMRRRTRQGGAAGDSTEQEEDHEAGIDIQHSDGDGPATTQQEESAGEIVADVTATNIEDVGHETEGVDTDEAEAMSEFSLVQPRDQSQDEPYDQSPQEQEEEPSNDEGQKTEADHEQLPSEEYEDDDVVDDSMSNDGKGEGHEIEGVMENPLFSPEHCAPQSIEEFTMEKEEDLDFEPEVDENETKSSKPETKEKDCPSWLDNVASPGKVGPEDENNIIIDEIVISDTDDIDELGDKIDAAYPGSKTGMEEDEESDEEKRGWRSEKSKTVRSGEPTSGTRRRTPPARRRRRSPVPRLRRRSR